MSVPSKIGPYDLIEEIGRGAMGVVFRGFDPAIGRAVAIKIIRYDPFAHALDQDEARRRFAREAAAAGRLSHPGIVTVFHLGSDGEHQYLVMEFVSGQSLEKMLVGRTLVGVPNALYMLRQLAAALDYAHGHDVIHRDIKPANIIVSPEGTAKIADFGIARILSGTFTLTGTVLGTPAYMAPEQIMAQIVGPRADQFSLAVLAYQLLTGHRPFEGASAPEMMRQVLHSEPPPVHAANLLLPPAVNDVFQRALSKDPDQRYGNCTEFVSEMGRLLASAGTPESVGPVAKHQAREGAAHASAAPTGASLFSRDSALPWLRSRRIWLSVAAGACLTILTVALFLAKTRKPAKDVTERYATTASRRGLDTEAAHVSGDSSRTVSAPPTSSKSARPSSPTATVPIVAEHYPTAVSTKDSGAEVTPPSGGSNSTLSAPPTSSKPIAFSATTGLALWAVAANISGTVMLEGRVLKVMVSDWSLSRPATYSDPADVVSIGVSVSRFTGEPTNSWQRLRKTDFNSHPLPLSLLPGHKIDLPPFGLNIPIDNFEVKAGDWLTFNIGLRHIKDGKETMGEVYAHWHPPVPPPAGWPGRPGTLTVTDGAAPSRTPTADPVLDANARAAEVNHAEGLQLFDRQNFAEAILKFTEAIRLKPDFAEAYFDRCRASDRLNSPSMASQRLEDCGKAIQLKSGFAEAYHYRGRAYAARLQYQLAMQDYDEALRYSPGDGSVITDRGFLYAAQNKPDLAIKEYDELIRIKPNDSYGYFARAREYNRQHRPELAIPDCNEAIRLNPKQGWAFWAYGARADAYRIQGKYDLAISDYDEALRLNPNWAEAYTSRAKAKEAIGDKPGADSDRERARELKR